MPRSFSTPHGRRADPKLFNVPDSHIHSFSNGGDERAMEMTQPPATWETSGHQMDLVTLVDTLLGPEDAAAASSSTMPTETSSTLLAPGRALSQGQLTLQGGQTCSSSSAMRVEPVNNDAAALPTPMQGL